MSEKKRALVVDDDDPIRTMLKKIVERQDLDVETARDGAEASERLDASNFDVIVLDLMMPKIDGFGVLKYIQEHYAERLGCTIIASAVPEHEILERFSVPVYRVHAKPFDIPTLLEDIRRCIRPAA